MIKAVAKTRYKASWDSAEYKRPPLYCYLAYEKGKFAVYEKGGPISEDRAEKMDAPWIDVSLLGYWMSFKEVRSMVKRGLIHKRAITIAVELML